MRPHEHYAREGTKTQRREWRRRIRSVLGTSSDPAPTVRDALEAAQALSQLLAAATSDRFYLTVVDSTTHETRAINEARAIVSQSAQMDLGGLLDKPLVVGDTFLRWDGVKFIRNHSGMDELKHQEGNA